MIAWGAMTGAAYLLLGLALGALHFDLLFGTHLGAMTANVQNFVEEASGFFPILSSSTPPTCCWVQAGLSLPRIAAPPACSCRWPGS